MDLLLLAEVPLGVAEGVGTVVVPSTYDTRVLMTVLTMVVRPPVASTRVDWMVVCSVVTSDDGPSVVEGDGVDEGCDEVGEGDDEGSEVLLSVETGTNADDEGSEEVEEGVSEVEEGISEVDEGVSEVEEGTSDVDDSGVDEGTKLENELENELEKELDSEVADSEVDEKKPPPLGVELEEEKPPAEELGPVGMDEVPLLEGCCCC